MFFNEQVLQEVYFGKTTGILAIEKQLGKFRRKYMGKFGRTFIPVNSDPELLKFNRMMENQFGFGTYTLTVHNQPSVNAFTCPIDFRFNAKAIGKEKRVIYDPKNGYRYNKEFDYACTQGIYSGALFNPNFTDEEIMALLMHETGHNFYIAMSNDNAILGNMFKFLLAYCAILDIISGHIEAIPQFSNTITGALNNIERELRSSNAGKIVAAVFFDAPKYVKDLFETAQDIGFIIKSILSFNLFLLINGTIGGIIRLLNPFNLLLLPRTYSDERSADNFATMYGYGPALTSAFEKMESHKANNSEILNALNSIPIIAPLYHLVGAPGLLIYSAVESHPGNLSRMKDQLDLLEREASKSDIDPKMRKIILSDCKAIQKEIDKATNINNHIKDPALAQHAYNKFLYQCTGSKRLKDMLLTSRNRFEQYDEKFYKSL